MNRNRKAKKMPELVVDIDHFCTTPLYRSALYIRYQWGWLCGSAKCGRILPESSYDFKSQKSISPWDKKIVVATAKINLPWGWSDEIAVLSVLSVLLKTNMHLNYFETYDWFWFKFLCLFGGRFAAPSARGGGGAPLAAMEPFLCITALERYAHTPPTRI